MIHSHQSDTMTIRYALAVLTMVLTGFGCGDRTSGDASAPAHLVVFVDHSVLTGPVTTTDTLLVSRLRDMAVQHLSSTGNSMAVYLVHAATREKPYRHSALNNIVAPDTTSGSKVARGLRKGQYRRQVDEWLQGELRRFVQVAFTSRIDRAYAGWTDLWGTLEVAAEDIRRLPKNATVRLVYFSDMRESMRGAGRRDFHRRPPAHREEADGWARTDVEWIRADMALSDVPWERVAIQMHVVQRPGQDINAYVGPYWVELLQQLGFARSAILYN
jgi:hypothetical protein